MIDSSNSIEGGCTDCNDPHSCGSYHVYVISLGDGTSYDFCGPDGEDCLRETG